MQRDSRVDYKEMMVFRVFDPLRAQYSRTRTSEGGFIEVSCRQWQSSPSCKSEGAHYVTST